MFNKVNITFPEKENFSSKLRVRINDVNFGNHLDYAALLEMVGNVRAQFFKSNDCNEMDIDGAGLMIKNVYVDYLSEVSFDELLELKLYVTDVKGPKANMLFLVKSLDTAKEVAKIAIRIVFFDYKNRKLRSAPEKFIHMAAPVSGIQLRN